jgi:Tol biopolymer transport system component
MSILGKRAIKLPALSVIFFCVSLLFCLPLLASRGIVAEDCFAFRFVADPSISPDGRQVAYTLTVIDSIANRRVSSIWVVPANGGSEPRQLSAEGFSSSAARWSSDGSRIAFLSSRNALSTGGEAARSQIWILRMDGGEARQLTHLKNGAGAFQWSPDGKHLVTLSRTGPSDSVSANARKSDVRHYKTISYKFNDTGWYNDKRSHLWTIDAATGAERQLTSGDDWNETDPQWSPDSARIAFASDRTGREYEGGFNKDVWVIPAEGGTLVKVSDHDFEDTAPRWSPDGHRTGI